jgi:hypothetical protein
MNWRRIKVFSLVLAVPLFFFTAGASAQAPSNPSSFSVIVEPLPIVATLTPGKVTSLQLKVINNNSETEDLVSEVDDFKLNDNTGKIQFDTSKASVASAWITLSNPKFTLTTDQIETENIKIDTPLTAGFSYSLAIVISQQKSATLNGAGQVLKGAVADFLLLNVNRPGAVSSLKLVSLTTSRGIFGWLPVTFQAKLQNNGNTIIEPTGNIFIQKSEMAQKPIDTIAVNPTQGYILPGSDRVLTNTWNDGFPVDKSVPTPSGAFSQHLVWNWSNLSKLRIGHYYGEMVAIYNNGKSDIPIQGQVGFWVLPWMIILVIAVLVAVLIVGFWTIFRKTFKRHKKGK